MEALYLDTGVSVLFYEQDDFSPLFGKPGHTGKVLICFSSGNNGICIDIHRLTPVLPSSRSDVGVR